MGDHLHRFAEEFAFSFSGDDIIIDAAGGDVVGLGGADVQKPLIMTQIEVCFRPVVGYEAFPVLVWVEGSRVYINIGIKLLDGDSKAAGLEEHTQGGGDDAFAEGGSDASGNEYVSGIGSHGWP